MLCGAHQLVMEGYKWHFNETVLTVSVIWDTPYSQSCFVKMPFLAFHHQLMCSTDYVNIVCLMKLIIWVLLPPINYYIVHTIFSQIIFSGTYSDLMLLLNLIKQTTLTWSAEHINWWWKATNGILTKQYWLYGVPPITATDAEMWRPF